MSRIKKIQNLLVALERKAVEEGDFRRKKEGIARVFTSPLVSGIPVGEKRGKNPIKILFTNRETINELIYMELITISKLVGWLGVYTEKEFLNIKSICSEKTNPIWNITFVEDIYNFAIEFKLFRDMQKVD